MDWTDAVDLYCERPAAGFWAEPFNAWSNLSFLLAGLWGAAEAVRRRLSHPALWLPIGLGVLVGVGSFLFHTFANRWSELADTFPIWIFVAIYLLAAMRWIGGMAQRKVTLWAGVVLLAGLATAVYTGLEGGETSRAAARGAAQAPDPFNGSLQYLPALAALLVFSGITACRRHPLSAWVWSATAAFLASLAFRSVDFRVCAAFPIGAHFMWHVMNGLLVALLLQLLIRAIAARAPGAA